MNDFQIAPPRFTLEQFQAQSKELLQTIQDWGYVWIDSGEDLFRVSMERPIQMSREYRYTLEDFIRESNAIEEIFRDPTQAEIDEAKRFEALDELRLEDLERFVKIYQPNAQLRSHPYLNVRIGNHIPPQGGAEVVAKVHGLLNLANERSLSAYELHHKYEQLHPFTDGNGRSGRMIWWWMMKHEDVWMRSLCFLRAWYYQSLAARQ